MEPFLYVSTVIRRSTDREMTGFFYKVDWRSKEIVAKIPVPPTYSGLVGSRGGSRGGRGMAVFDGKLYAATFDKVLVYDTDYRLQLAFSHPLVLGHHEIQVDAEGIWCCSTLIDALVRLDHAAQLLDACFLSEEPALLGAGARLVPRDRAQNYLAEAEQDDDGTLLDEQFHLNTVTQGKDEVHAFACTRGHLLRIRPRVELIATLPQLVGAHNVQLRQGRLFANNTQARAFEIYEPEDLMSPAVRVQLDDTVGRSEQFATSGWIRGMCWVEPALVVVGTSPAGLISIDVAKGRVVDRLQLEADVEHAVHGLTSSSV
jgi:hypothetical protein